MALRILFFGILRDRFGEEQQLPMAAGATAETVRAHFRAHASDLQALWPSIAVAVNGHYAAPDAPLHDGDEVALLPPVSGGLC